MLRHTDFKIFYVHILPTNNNNKKIKTPLAINSECVSSSTRTNPCSSFPLTNTLQGDRPAFYAQMAAPTGGKSVPSRCGCVWAALSQGPPCHLSTCSSSGPEIRCLWRGKSLIWVGRAWRRELQGVEPLCQALPCWIPAGNFFGVHSSTFCPEILKAMSTTVTVEKGGVVWKVQPPPQGGALPASPAVWAACAGPLHFPQRHFHSAEGGELSLGRLRQAQRKLMVESTLFSLLECFIANQESPLSNCCDLK